MPGESISIDELMEVLDMGGMPALRDLVEAKQRERKRKLREQLTESISEIRRSKRDAAMRSQMARGNFGQR